MPVKSGRDRAAVDDTAAGAGIAEDGDVGDENALPGGASLPLLLMPPEKLVMPKIPIAVLFPEMTPVLVMPPPGPPEPNTATVLTKIPSDFPLIVPALLMPPVKVVTSLTLTPLEPAAILPPLLLTTPPVKIEVSSTKTPALGRATVRWRSCRHW